MAFILKFELAAKVKLNKLKNDSSQKGTYKAVQKCLGYLETNPKHPSLQTHQFISQKGPKDEKVYTAYAQQKRPAAYRIFWYYGPQKREITIVAITPHPD